MLVRVFLFILMAAGLAGFGAVAWISTRPPPIATATAAPVPPPVTKVTVLVAAHPLHAGSLLKPEDVGTREAAKESLPEGYSEDNLANRRALVGVMVRRTLGKDDVLLQTDMMHPGDHGFLAAVIAPGMRAVTIGVDAVSGSAGLIWPGDRVDIVMTEAIEDPTVPAGRRVLAETVQRNARVVAIDQKLVEGAVPGVADAQPARTVTLEVTANEVERIAVAGRIGRLSLSVRPPDSDQSADSKGAVFASDVSSALSAQPAPRVENVLKIQSGSTDAKEYRF
jgi:pilus assembly protein CpaB